MKLSIGDLHFQYDGWTQKYTHHIWCLLIDSNKILNLIKINSNDTYHENNWLNRTGSFSQARFVYITGKVRKNREIT